MGRRVRHFNPRHAGAAMALDSRYIAAANISGSNLTTWNSRTTSTYNASTISANPQFVANVRGGQPVVRFATTPTGMNSANVSFRTSHIISVFDKKSNPGQVLGDIRTLICRGSTNSASRQFLVSYYGTAVDIQVSNGTLFPSASAAIGVGWSHVDAYVETTVIGIAVNLGSYVTNTYAFTPAANTSITVGVTRESNNNIRGFDSDVGAITLFSSRQSASMRRRCVHAQAFAFKVPV